MLKHSRSELQLKLKLSSEPNFSEDILILVIEAKKNGNFRAFVIITSLMLHLQMEGLQMFGKLHSVSVMQFSVNTLL